MACRIAPRPLGLAFGEESTGASDDLHAATKLARQMVTSFGMSEELGHVTIGEAAGEVFSGPRSRTSARSARTRST